MTVETILRLLIEHPKRVWIVTLLTMLVGLVFTWPAVDNYCAASSKYAELRAEVAQGQERGGKIGLYKEQAEKKLAESKALEAKALTAEETEDLRNRLTTMVKDAGCKMRRIKLGDALTRTWFEEDNPLDTRSRADSDKKSPFKLKSQPLLLSIAGPLDKVNDFLARLGQEDKLIHTGSLMLKRSTEDQAQVELDLELFLFDLVRAEAKKA